MKTREIYILLISCFVLVIFWIGFSVYHNSITSTIPRKLNIQIIPINPNFDEKTISDIKTRPQITPVYENQTLTEQNTISNTATTSGGSI
jgi:hypothetical protein